MPTRPLALRPTAWPWWAQVLLIAAAARAVSAWVFVRAAAGQPDSYWGPGPPGYGAFVGVFWDGSWYREIAEQGYPATLPLSEDGSVQQSAWAFYPLFPLLVRGLRALTGGTWEVVAPTTSLVLGVVALLLLDRLVQGGVDARRGDTPSSRRLALGTVLLVAVYPASPVLQAAYTESLSFLLVVLTLLLMTRHSYVAAGAAVAALGFTRAVALPMAVVVAVHLVVRLRDHRAGRSVLARSEAFRIAALAAVAVAAGFAWPILVGVRTGVPDAYIRTQAAWRGTFSSAPVVPWFEMADYLFGGVGIVVLAAVVLAVLGLAISPEARAAGPEVQAWGIAYPVWLIGAAFPQTSLIRFLVLAFPLALAVVGLVRTRGGLAALVVASVVGQAVWVTWLWQLTTPTAWPP